VSNVAAGRETALATAAVGLYCPGMLSWAESIDSPAGQSGFAGVVWVGRGGETELAKAYGLADRAHQIPNTIGTRFAIASGTKGLTAVTVVSLISDGALRLSTAARSVLGEDLPLIGGDVTVEHLLAHRSGIGDYVDEEAGHQITDYVLTVPAQDLAGTEQYLAVLGGHPAKFPAGERFCYCNSGYVVLALIAERVSGVPFPRLVQERVCAPAGMCDTAFVRSDELPGRAALGYLPIEGTSRTNVYHLPVLGSGDGGIYSTAADISAFWRSLLTSKIVPAEWVAEMVRPRSDVPSESMRYGLGFWLGGHDSTVMLEGLDAGVSFRSVHDPTSALTHTVISNSSDGAWPITRRLDELLAS
jgi:CubicO group peptidase (beta-lactamase class C family)